jgi:hypothetical protein
MNKINEDKATRAELIALYTEILEKNKALNLSNIQLNDAINTIHTFNEQHLRQIIKEHNNIHGDIFVKAPAVAQPHYNKKPKN